MAGIQAGRTVATLPRHLYWRILGVLRPAEYAARRLIVMATCKLDLKVRPMRPRSAAPGRETAASAGGRREPPGDMVAVLPAFALFDPFKRTGSPWQEPDGIVALYGDDPRPALPPDEPVDAKALCRRSARSPTRLAIWRDRRCGWRGGARGVTSKTANRGAGRRFARAARPASGSGRKRRSRAF